MMDGLPDVCGHLAEEDKQAAADSTSRALFGSLAGAGWLPDLREAPSDDQMPLTWRARRGLEPQPSDP